MDFLARITGKKPKWVVVSILGDGWKWLSPCVILNWKNIIVHFCLFKLYENIIFSIRLICFKKRSWPDNLQVHSHLLESLEPRRDAPLLHYTRLGLPVERTGRIVGSNVDWWSWGKRRLQYYQWIHLLEDVSSTSYTGSYFGSKFFLKIRHFCVVYLKWLTVCMHRMSSFLKHFQAFNFDIRQMNWDYYLFDYLIGVKRYVLKEDLTNLPVARARLNRFVQKLRFE